MCQAVSGFEEKFSPDALKVFGQKIAKSKYPFVISETPGGTPNPEFDEGEGDLDVQVGLCRKTRISCVFALLVCGYCQLKN